MCNLHNKLHNVIFKKSEKKNLLAIFCMILLFSFVQQLQCVNVEKMLYCIYKHICTII